MAAASKKKAKKKKTQKVSKKSTKKAVSKKKTVTKTAAKKVKKKAVKKKSTKKAGSAKKSAGVSPLPATTGLDGSHSVVPGIEPYKPKKGEEYMSEPQLAHFTKILEIWRGQLVSDINRTIHTMQDETINHPDPNDRATQETDMSLELRSRDRERKLIKKIDETLVKIEEEDYGYCEKCGIEIGVARLEARPTATLCIDCKTLDEIRERQMV